MKNIISFFPPEVLKEATALFRSVKTVTFSGSGNSSSKSMLIADILRDKKNNIGNVLYVVSDLSEVDIVRKTMEMWSDVPVFTYRCRPKEERLTFSYGSEFDRLVNIESVQFISRIFTNKKACFIVDFASLLQNFPDIREIDGKKNTLIRGEEVNLVNLIQYLVQSGYEMSEENFLQKGEYYRKADSLYLFPVNYENVVRIDIDFDKVESISQVAKNDYSKVEKSFTEIDIFPLDFTAYTHNIVDLFVGNGVIIDDEVDVVDEYYELWNEFMAYAAEKSFTISFTSFNDDEKLHRHMHFISILKYQNPHDLANDFRDKISSGWKVLFFTKKITEVRAILSDQSVPFKVGLDQENFQSSSIFLIEVHKEDVFPPSFQSSEQKILLLNDSDVAFFREQKKKNVTRNIFDDFLTGLKLGDFVVHSDHGIARFLGLDQKTVDSVTKEYLKLGYAENDKLFVPIDQADKVNKYIGSEELMPKLTRLGSAEWNTITSKVKKETQKIAKELLKLYAERRSAKGFKFKDDDILQDKFERTFPYEETPGQIKAINDVKADMEKPEPMDRLVCGDVGFGKTEVAMRAAFKAVQSGKQAALISPITILADQHYKSFCKRMEEFHVRIEMLSRFRTSSEQKKIVEALAKGEIDIIIGTHRLLQQDIRIKNLGLVIIDEEQRFGVKQKERLKELRKEVDILTLTATPIPRTLNICLNKLRDITTITTPPFGRLPVITEVRKYSASLVREAILRELERKGQVYFLHNRVQTIDSFADKLRSLVPEARFGVAHGKLGSGDLEERIMAFKDHKFDVLVSSTIIENGIDLENANTLIVNNAEKFGLAQLYQLRGRVGRGKRQAYAFFLYHGQRLKLDAKKRLRAIVEASELGSGFQIAMKDLEIRGAGDILGANQHGVINVVGVSHFIRMLNKAVEDLKTGRIMEGEETPEEVSIELPVPAYIPSSYIVNSDDKIAAYQKLSAADNQEYLNEIREELIQDYGAMPVEVVNLLSIIELKILAKKAGLINIKAEMMPMSQDKEVVLSLSKKVKPANIINLLEYNALWTITGSRLRINIKELGADWFGELYNCIEKLGDAAEHGVR